MENETRTPSTAIAPVASIADARKRKEEQDTAPLEAYKPNAARIQEGKDDWMITTCDGEQTYVYLATKGPKAKRFKVTEVYPGMAKKRTAIRDVKEPKDLLLLGKHENISDVIEDIADALFGDLELEDDGTEG